MDGFYIHFFPKPEFSIQMLRILIRQAGKQIQGVINSAYKIERQAAGMLILKKLMRRRSHA